MIRSLLLAALLRGGPAADPEPPPTPPPPPAVLEGRPLDGSLDRYRTPLEALTERMLGSASRAVRFDWRKKTVGFGVMGGQLLELNNFNTARLGGFARMPLGELMATVGFSRAFVWGSGSTEQLALTPYRQLARPSRFELDLDLAYPLVEGVVTPRFGLPAAELVFSVDLGLRYAFYAHALDGASAGEVASAIFSPRLSQKELANLGPQRLPGMELEATRYALTLGFCLDVYFQPGFFFTPRVVVAPPLFTLANSAAGLGLWWELTLSLGWML